MCLNEKNTSFAGFTLFFTLEKTFSLHFGGK